MSKTIKIERVLQLLIIQVSPWRIYQRAAGLGVEGAAEPRGPCYRQVGGESSKDIFIH